MLNIIWYFKYVKSVRKIDKLQERAPRLHQNENEVDRVLMNIKNDRLENSDHFHKQTLCFWYTNRMGFQLIT